MKTKTKTYKKITLAQARRVLEVVDAGLSSGLGKPIPGQMCVEAAVVFALGQPHGDEPECVAPSVRAFKIRLNDSKWSSNEARAKGMRAIAIAQLGTRGEIDEKLFVKTLAELTIRRIVPIALRAAAVQYPANKAALEAAAVRCEKEGTREAALNAREIAAYAAYAADANAAAYATNAADAANAAAAAANAAAAAANAADAANAAAAAANAADYVKKRDSVLSIAASLGVEALRIVGAAGVKLLDKLIPEAK